MKTPTLKPTPDAELERESQLPGFLSLTLELIKHDSPLLFDLLEAAEITAATEESE